MVQKPEDLIEEFDTKVKVLSPFITLGASSGSASPQSARAIIRRAEIRVVNLKEVGMVENEEILKN